MGYHFIAQLLAGKGPDPAAEIDTILAEAAADDNHRAILATRKPGSSWKAARGESFALMFYKNPDKDTITGLVANIVLLRSGAPAEVPPLYGPFLDKLKGWWTVKNPRRIRTGISLEDVDGRSMSGTERAVTTFGGDCTFAYWDFEYSPFDTLCSKETAGAR